VENGSLKELHIPHCAATSLARAPKQVLGLRLLYGVGKGGRPRRHTKEVLYVYQQEKLQVLPEIRSISGAIGGQQHLQKSQIWVQHRVQGSQLK